MWRGVRTARGLGATLLLPLGCSMDSLALTSLDGDTFDLLPFVQERNDTK